MAEVEQALRMSEMTEDMKVQCVADNLEAHKYANNGDRAVYLIKLIRTLDNYRKRDSKGRFRKVNH